MILEIFEDDLTKHDLSDVNHHSARAIIKKNSQILLLYSKTQDFYMLPGGRIEDKETPKDCVIREVLEETGYHVDVIRKTLVIQEHYRTSNWNSHFFLCQLHDQLKTDVHWTDEELRLGIEPIWIDPIDALTLLDQHDTKFPHGYNIMQREFLALLNSL